MKFSRYAITILKFLTGNSILQVTQFVTGLVIIRMMPTKAYAVYTLYLAAWSLGNQILDFGIPASIMRLVGSEFHNREKLNRYISAGLQLRIPLTIIVASISIPLLYTASVRASVPIHTFLVLGVCLIGCFILTAQKDLLSIPLLMQGRIFTTANADSTGEVIRLISILSIIGLKLLTPVALALTSVLGAAISFIMIRQSTDIIRDQNNCVLGLERNQIIASVAPLIPNIFFGAFQGQIVVLVASLVGSTTQVASVGALQKLAMAISLLNRANTVIIGPSIAKLTDERLWKKILQVISVSLVIAILIVSIGWYFPDMLLALLGEQYSSLGKAVGIVTTTMGLGYLVAVLYTIARYRGWIGWGNSFLFIVLVLFSQAIAMAIYDMRTVSGVLMLGLAAAIARLIAQLMVVLSARFWPTLLGIKVMETKP